jgi:sulfite exporter TauE/SafE
VSGGNFIPILGWGFLLGIRHALEADHVAAVASLASRSRSPASTARIAAIWGMGHAAVLVLLGSILIGLDATLPDGIARAFEFAAGAMVVILGIGVLRRLRRKRLHLHVHQHGEGVRHVHLHSHQGEVSHDPAHHEHDHAPLPLQRAFLIGSVHGLAGSAALVLLAIPLGHSLAREIAYVAVFGLGSIFGMVLFSVAISLPLQVSARRLSWAANGLEGVLGITNIVLGCWIAARASLF